MLPSLVRMKSFLGAREANNTMGDHSDVDSRMRAVLAISELSALLGAAAVTKPSTEVAADDVDSVAVWSQTAAVKHPAKAMLALPVLCPPFSDPTSVMIADPSSFEYELDEDMDEDDNDNANVVRTKSGAAKVRFQTTVTIVPITSHRDMAPDVVERIWTSLDEVKQQARRNAKEYRYDGKQWRTATEEQDMIYDPVSGERIHPATWACLQRQKHQNNLELIVRDEWSRLALLEHKYRQRRERRKQMREANGRIRHE